MHTIKNFWFYLLIAIIFFSFIVFEYFYPLPEANITYTKEYQYKSFEHLISFLKLLISWSLAIIGGIAFLLKSHIESSLLKKKTQLYLIESSAFSSAVSIFFGHLAVNNLIIAMSENNYAVSDNYISWLIRLQYFSLLLSVVFFIISIHFIIQSIDNHYEKGD